jgi:ATP-dependent DNA helicase RecG
LESAPSVDAKVTPEVTPEATPEVARLRRVGGEPLSRQELQDQLGLRDDEHFRKTYLLPALAAGVIEMTAPDRPTSRLQKYRITAKGRTWLVQKEQGKKKR